MLKIMTLLASVFLLSGCCRLLGICAGASVSVQTSIGPPYEIAGEETETSASSSGIDRLIASPTATERTRPTP